MKRGPRRARIQGEDRWGKLAVWEGAFRGGDADFKEAVTRACTGSFDHPLTPVMRDEGIDLYSARFREIAGAALDHPNFTVLRFERGLRKELVRFLRAHIDVPQPLLTAIRDHPPIRSSEHGPYQDYYDDELRELVGEGRAGCASVSGTGTDATAAGARERRPEPPEPAIRPRRPRAGSRSTARPGHAPSSPTGTWTPA